MELRPGYKQTEVGVIPEDWEVVQLSQLIDESRSIRYGIVQPGEYEPTGRFMVRGQDYSKGWVGQSELFRVSDAIEQRYRNARLKPGDLIITIVGAGTGHVEEVPQWLDGANLTQTTARIAINETKTDARFCKFMLQSAVGKRQVANFLKGAAQPGLNCGDVERFFVPLPPTTTEQRAISATLGDVDALLGALTQLIAKKRDLKQAAMQQLLTGQTRLPGFHGEWEVRRLGDVVEIVSGGTPKTGVPAYWNGGIKWCTPTDITGTGSKYLTETARTISTLGLASCSARLLPAGALLLCSRATIGEVKIAAGAICTNQGFKSLICGQDVNNEFLYYLLLTMKPQMVERAIGSTFLELSKKDTAMLEVTLPMLAEQTAIAALLSDMDAELATLEQRLAKTHALKQGMMQELLTGRTRLV